MLVNFTSSKKILENHGLPVVKTGIFKSLEDAVSFAEEVGYPVVIKISSPEISHKTDVGGVRTGIENSEELKKVFKEFQERFQEREIEGIVVQKQIKGKEIVLGFKRDPEFGPVLMFGLGGIFIEIFNDIVLRVAPITKEESMEMIKETKSFKVLSGYRGQESVNIEKLAEMIVKMSELSMKEENIKEMDLNPVIINDKEALICDIRIIV